MRYFRFASSFTFGVSVIWLEVHWVLADRFVKFLGIGPDTFALLVCLGFWYLSRNFGIVCGHGFVEWLPFVFILDCFVIFYKCLSLRLCLYLMQFLTVVGGEESS